MVADQRLEGCEVVVDCAAVEEGERHDEVPTGHRREAMVQALGVLSGVC